MRYLISLSVLILSLGCSITSDKDETTSNRPTNKPELSNNTIHFHVAQLAKQMFDTALFIDTNKSISVGTFLPTKSLGTGLVSSESLLGHQLQESFITLAAQAGLKVLEYKSMNQIMLKDEKDIMLSRTVSNLSQKFDTDYYLTGTFIKEESNYIVNARIINVNSKAVIAAATDFIPVNSMWSDSKVMIKNQHIYRKGY